MPRAWSDKDERQYEEIKKSAKDRGSSEERAKQISSINRSIGSVLMPKSKGAKAANNELGPEQSDATGNAEGNGNFPEVDDQGAKADPLKRKAEQHESEPGENLEDYQG